MCIVTGFRYHRPGIYSAIEIGVDTTYLEIQIPRRRTALGAYRDVITEVDFHQLLIVGGLHHPDRFAFHPSAKRRHYQINAGFIVKVQPFAAHRHRRPRPVFQHQETGVVAGVRHGEIHHFLTSIIDSQRHN